MDIAKLKELREASPFRPFSIDLADGRQLHVRHRDFISISPEGRTCIVWQPDDSMTIVDVRLIQSITQGPPPQTDAA
ncbi:MAG: hypothetical protein H6840_08780 [Planctomycetes bacterium]|nr:hypothetical protein [Planctomycetota bacterium]